MGILVARDGRHADPVREFESSRRTIQESTTTTPKKDSPEKAKSASKKPATKGKTELSDEELKKVTGGAKTIFADDWKGSQ
jgi:bacteriocin-like protein